MDFFFSWKCYWIETKIKIEIFVQKWVQLIVFDVETVELPPLMYLVLFMNENGIFLVCILFIVSTGDEKPTTKHQMPAEGFCCDPILKREEARLSLLC